MEIWEKDESVCVCVLNREERERVGGGTSPKREREMEEELRRREGNPQESYETWKEAFKEEELSKDLLLFW